MLWVTDEAQASNGLSGGAIAGAIRALVNALCSCGHQQSVISAAVFCSLLIEHQLVLCLGLSQCNQIDAQICCLFGLFMSARMEKMLPMVAAYPAMTLADLQNHKVLFRHNGCTAFVHKCFRHHILAFMIKVVVSCLQAPWWAPLSVLLCWQFWASLP